MKKIYILHGWTYNKTKWLPLKASLEKKLKIQVELLDIPGLTGKIDKPWSIEDYVQWMYDKTKNSKGKVVLIGGSNGGRICLNFTLKYQDRVSHLFLIDSAGIYRDDILYVLKNFVFKIIAKIGKLFTHKERLKMFLYKLNRDNDYVLASDVMKKTLVSLISSDKKLDLTKIKAPTTIIWGENDKTTPLWMGKRMNTLIVHSRFFIIKNARHSPQFTNTKEVIDIISNTI